MPYSLVVRPGALTVCRLSGDAPLPEPPTDGFWSVTRSADEVSVVCQPDAAPTGATREGPWRRLEVAGPLDFGMTGVLAGIAAPLAEAGIPIFVLSTYDTDHLLVREERLEEAVRALAAAGHEVAREERP